MQSIESSVVSQTSVLRTLCSAAAFVAASWLPAQTPPPPANIDVEHRSGQTFITWDEVGSISGESYVIYRVDAAAGPITSTAGLAELFEVWEDSAEMFADRRGDNMGGYVPRYVQRAVIQDDQPQLAAGRGMFVLTLRGTDFPTGASGSAYYAVVTRHNGQDSVVVNAPGGNGHGPEPESVADPEPVRASHTILPNGAGRVDIFIQYLDSRRVNTTFMAPNPLNNFWGEPNPASPRVANAKQYACTYRVAVPANNPPVPLPVILKLHVRTRNNLQPDYGPPPYNAIEIAPIDVNNTWWFGFATTHDYRLGGYPSAGRIANYTEERVLRMVHDLLRDTRFGYSPDSQRVYVHGHSMGGSGALAMAMRYPAVFAAAHASKPMTNYVAYVNGPQPGWDYRDEIQRVWGLGSISLPTRFDAPNGWAAHLQPYAGTVNRLWRWQNHQLQFTNMMREDMVPMGIVQGLDDDTIPGDTQADPLYAPLVAANRCLGARVNCSGHDPAAFTGMPAALNSVGNVPFYGLQVRRDETVPGFANLRAHPGPGLCVPPSACLDCSNGGTGLNQYFRDIEWSASWVAPVWAPAPVDTATGWEMSFRVPVGNVYAVDITPRRLQAFQPQPNATYHWVNVQQNLPAPGIVDRGSATADANGVLTVPGFVITGFGNRLMIF